MKDKWNERYNSEEYFFGKEPNDFFKEVIDNIQPGKALFIGEGEGRNSVYAASLGWEVDAIDVSEVGKQKAEKLSAERNVNINYKISNAFDFTYLQSTYDAIVLIYFHVEKELRDEYYNQIISSIKPGGNIILLVYDEEQIKNNSNGPQDINILYTLENIAETFIDLEFKIFAKEVITRMKKGVSQKSTVIKFVGKKMI
ncbi:MAG: class I SAM-dependent methyltransferase [Melioribacteraceae bacterium]|nr:class I SAM-dependent methyltransferase [Melioribacteraceae bacterium]